MWKGEKDMYEDVSQCTSGCSCDRTRRISPIKSGNCFLISPINFSDCAKEWNIIGEMFQPFIALIPSLTTPLMSACSPCILIAHLRSPPLVHSPRNSQKCLCRMLFFSTTQGFFFVIVTLEVCETWKFQCGLFISWFNWFVIHLDKIVAGLNFKCIL